MDLRYPPFETRNNKNEAEGISVDVFKAFGKYLNREVEIVPMEFGNLIISLQNGSIDVVIASIARALSLNPEIIFLDEPTSALDPILTDEVLSSIEDLKDLGKDFIFVTHVMSFVKDFADYVIYMDKGKIVEHGLPDILDNPKTLELKEFMSKVR